MSARVARIDVAGNDEMRPSGNAFEEIRRVHGDRSCDNDNREISPTPLPRGDQRREPHPDERRLLCVLERREVQVVVWQPHQSLRLISAE